jgi:hypothetical protein
MSALPIPIWGGGGGEWHISFNQGKFFTVLYCKQTSSPHQAHTHQANPKQNIVYIMFSFQHQYRTFCEIKIEEGGALSTKYLKTSFCATSSDPAVKLLEQL